MRWHRAFPKNDLTSTETKESQLSMTKLNDSELLSIYFRTRFRTNESGRIEGENDPGCSPGPLFFLAGCAMGNVSGLHADVSNSAADKIIALTKTEPPFTRMDSPPKHFDRYIELLSQNEFAPCPRLGASFFAFGLSLTL
jgi:hypothetical protein